MLRSRLITLLIIFTVLASVVLHTFPANALPSYGPGVHPGDYVVYGEFSQNSTSPSPTPFSGNISSLKLQVDNVNSLTNTVNASFIINYQNGTHATQPISGNTLTGQGNLFPYITAGNLTAGDLFFKPIQPFYNAYIVNETVNRVYAGALRTVNLLNFTITYPQQTIRVTFYWDALTGLVLDATENVNSTSPGLNTLAIHFKATQTNIWSSTTNPDYALDASAQSSAVIHSGDSTSYRLDLSSLNGFTGIINLATSLPSSNMTHPPSITVNPSTLQLSNLQHSSAILTFSSDTATKIGSYVITANATSGTTTHQALLLVVIAPPDFIMNASPANLTLAENTTKNSTITVTGRGGFTGTVILQAQTQPFGTIVAARLSTTSIFLNATRTSGTSTLTVDATNSLPGTASIYVYAQGGNIYANTYLPVNVTGPDFRMVANPTVLDLKQGQTGTSTITLTSLEGFSGTVNLSATGFGTITAVLSNGSVTLTPGGNAKTTATLTAGLTTAPGFYSVQVTGAGPNGLTRYAYVELNVTGPDFTITASSTFLTLHPGQTGNSTLTLSARDKLNGTITLTATSFSSFLQPSINPSIVTLSSTITSATALLTVSIPLNVGPGYNTIQVAATGGNLVHYIYITINIIAPDFSVTTNPGFVSMPQGGQATTTVSLSSIDNFTGTVLLSTSSSLYLSASFSNAQVNLAPGGSATTTMTIQSFSFTPVGSYYLQIMANSGAHFRSTQVYVNVIGPDFSLSANPSFLVMRQGETTNSTISITSLDNLAGNATIFNAFSNPIIVAPQHTNVTLTANSTSTTSFRFTVPANIIPGYFYVHLTANLGSVSHDLYIQVQIIGPDFSLFANPSSLTIQRGTSATSTINLTSLDGFNKTVSLRLSSYGLTVIPSNTTVTLTSGGTAAVTVTIQAPSSTPPGSYYVSINANSTILFHYTQINVQVVGPDFSIQSNPFFLTIQAGKSAQSTITVTSLDGFTGNVTLTTNFFVIGTNFTSPLNVTLTPRTLTLSPGATVSATLNITTSPAVTGQNFTIYVIATSGNVTHSTPVSVSIIGPTIGLSANPSLLVIPQGGSATSTVTATSIQGFSGEVSFAGTSYNGITSSFTPQNVSLPAGGSANSTIRIVVSPATSPGYYTIVASGYASGVSRYTFVTVEVIAGPSFTITVSPIFLNLAAGNSGHATLSVTGSGGFSDTIHLSSFSSPAGLETSITPGMVVLNSTTTSSTAQVTITVPAGLRSGYYNANIFANATSRFENITVLVQVVGPDFGIFASPSLITMGTSGIVTTTINLFGINGFSGTIDLSAVSVVPGEPSSFSPTKLTLTPSHPNATSTLTISIEPGSLCCTNLYTVIASLEAGSNATTLVHSTIVTVQVPPLANFRVIPITGPLTISRGSSGGEFLSIFSIYGFSGNVTITSQITPQGPTVSPNQTTISLVPNGSGSTILQVSVGVDTQPGNYTLFLNATSAGITHTNSVEITVPPGPDFGIVANPTAIKIGPTLSATSTITLFGINGFSGTVQLSYVVSAGPGVTASFNPINVTLSPSSPNATATMTITVAPGTYPGPYAIGVVASLVTNSNATSLVHFTTVSILVPVIPNFQMLVSTGLLTIAQGSSGQVHLTLNSLNGFSGNVAITAEIFPQGPTISPVQTSVTLSNNGTVGADLIVSVPVNARTGYYTLALNATSAGITHPNSLLVLVTPRPDFSITASPAFQNTQAGHAASAVAVLTAQDGFTGPVQLFTIVSPSGVSAVPNPSTVQLTSNSTATILVSISTTTATSPGNYTLDIIGNSTSGAHTVSITVTVTPPPDFKLTSSTSALIIQTGASATVTVSVSPAAGFNSPVTLSTTAPLGFTASFSINPIIGGTGTSTLTITIGSSVSAGTYSITVNGNSGSITHATTLNVTVTASARTTFSVNQVSWIRKLSVTKNGGIQTFTLTIRNTGKTPAYMQLLATGNSTNLKSSFNKVSSVALLAPGKSITISLSQPFNTTSIGLKFNFTIQLLFGNSIDTTGNILSPQTTQVAKGAFTVVS